MAGSVIARAGRASIGRLYALCFSLGWFLLGFPDDRDHRPLVFALLVWAVPRVDAVPLFFVPIATKAHGNLSLNRLCLQRLD